VRDFYLINNTDSLYPTITSIPYPKAGTENSTCRIGVFSFSSAKTTWIAHPQDEEFYIPYMEWVDDSQIVFQRMNRLQNKVEVTLANAATGQIKVILTDTDEAWLDLVTPIEWINDNQHFIWLSERDGWKHLYTVSQAGKMNLITPGEFDVISVEGIDRKNGWIYVIASPDNPTQRYLYRASFKGTKVERITPKNQPGTHTYQISPDGNLAMHSFSAALQPTRYEIVRLPDHSVIRILETNEKLAAQLEQIPERNISFFRVKTAHAEMDAWEIKPHNFDASKKYPLLLFVYGEPHNTTVKDSWGRTRDLWFQMLAQRGYVVMSIDNRGTPQPRGREWRKIAYKQIGIISSLDQKEAVDEIAKMKPYVDANRVGIWGWSGGGSTTLNALFRYPETFHVGMAVAPGAHAKYYDTIYQERYMGLPQDDPDAYDECSPLTFAKNLQGTLLLIHGTGDDNVHYQATEVLINELIKHNKQFTMMSYPNRTHGIREGEGTTTHLYTLMTNFLLENLPVD
jgi:dipeptidyl-peptidase-4